MESVYSSCLNTCNNIYLSFLEHLKNSWANISYTEYFAITLLLVLCSISVLMLLHQSEFDDRIRDNESYVLQIEKNLRQAEEDMRKAINILQNLYSQDSIDRENQMALDLNNEKELS